jgi:rhodanese-related sulfurtransferase
MSMTKEAVKDKMQDHNVVVLNVLPDNDYARMHITGSENLSLGLNSSDFVEAVEKKYGKNKFFITYCAGLTCNAGSDAAKALTNKGFKANDYPGGMKEWFEAGFPTEGTQPNFSKVEVTLPAIVAKAK